jgi:hypothetical protein
MSRGSCLSSKLYDKIIKMPTKSHETIPLIFLFLMRVWPQIMVHWLGCHTVTGSLDDCVEKDGTFYITKDGT